MACIGKRFETRPAATPGTAAANSTATGTAAASTSTTTASATATTAPAPNTATSAPPRQRAAPQRPQRRQPTLRHPARRRPLQESTPTAARADSRIGLARGYRADDAHRRRTLCGCRKHSIAVGRIRCRGRGRSLPGADDAPGACCHHACRHHACHRHRQQSGSRTRDRAKRRRDGCRPCLYFCRASDDARRSKCRRAVGGSCRCPASG